MSKYKHGNEIHEQGKRQNEWTTYYCSDIQDYINYILKKALTTIPAIYVYINRIDNRFLFKIKDGYKLELQTPERIRLFGSTEKLIHKTKNGENRSNLEVIEVALV